MIDPKGPKHGVHRQHDSKEPHFEQGGASAERPMYATEPDAGGPGAGPDDRSAGGGWEVPGSGQSGQPEQPSQQDSPGEPAQADQEVVEVDLRQALAAAQAKAAENHEQHLRCLAEIENVRRRAQEDVSKAHKFAIEAFAENLLPVRDSLEMALTTPVPSVESLREGVEATLRQLTQAFERNRIVVIDPLHEKFDPNRHQAISVAPSKDVAPNHVVSVLQKGYLINDRVLRPALVTVSQSG
jgi:molecular chaperone GrpE